MMQGFDLLSYGKAVERLIAEWRRYTAEVLRQSSDLGSAREHFVQQILKNILPQSVVIGSGEIVDGRGNRSSQQDVIVYRANFPVITSLTPVNTYLIEGVIATLEVKSDLSTGDPNNLTIAFKNSSSVLSLQKQAQIMRGEPDQIELLKQISSVRTYVIGYGGWKTKSALLTNYTSATNIVGGLIPTIVCQPGFCIVQNDRFFNPHESNITNPLLLNEDYPYAVLLHHLLKVVMMNTSGSEVVAPGVDAAMEYNLGPYFNFTPKLEFTPLVIQKEDKVKREETK